MTSATTEPPADTESFDELSTTPSGTSGSSPASSALRRLGLSTTTDAFGVTHGISWWSSDQNIRMCDAVPNQAENDALRWITCIACARRWRGLQSYFDRVAERARENGHVSTWPGRRRRLEDR